MERVDVAGSVTVCYVRVLARAWFMLCSHWQVIESAEDRTLKKLLSRRQARALLLNALLILTTTIAHDDVAEASPEPTNLICRVTYFFLKSPFFFEVGCQ